MFINFVIDASDKGDIIKAIKLLSYHLNEEVENMGNKDKIEFEDLKELINSVPFEARMILTEARIIYGPLEELPITYPGLIPGAYNYIDNGLKIHYLRTKLISLENSLHINAIGILEDFFRKYGPVQKLMGATVDYLSSEIKPEMLEEAYNWLIDKVKLWEEEHEGKIMEEKEAKCQKLNSDPVQPKDG